MSTGTSGGRDFLSLGGAMGELIRQQDWSKTELGPIEGWPERLKGYVAMMLQMPSPAIIFWGPKQRQIYNHGYSFIMGPRHPAYYGATYQDCWPDTYPIIAPWMARVMNEGEVIQVENELFVLTRLGFEEEAYFTFSFVPMLDDDGSIGGFIQPVHEVTSTVIGARRHETLRGLVPHAGRDTATPAGHASDALGAIRAALAANPKDLPFSLVYLGDPSGLRLAASTGLDEGLDPEVTRAAAQRVLASSKAEQIEGLAAALGPSNRGAWGTPTASALALPLRIGATEGVVVLGISPRLPFDEAYRTFFEAVAHDIGSTLAAERDERAVEGLQQLFAAVVDNQPELAWTARPDGYVDFYNRRWRDFTGISSDELKGWGWEKVHDPAILPQVVERWRQSLATGEPFTMEFPLRGADGQFRWFLTRNVPLCDSSGAIVRWFGSSTDVHDLREMRASTEALLADVQSQAAEMREALLTMRRDKEQAEAELARLRDSARGPS